jgi:hypothetical protein
VLDQIGSGDGCRKQDARIAVAVIQIHGNDELLLRQTVGLSKERTASIGERVARLGSSAPAADAIGIGKGQEQPGHVPYLPLHACIGAELPGKLARKAARALHRCLVHRVGAAGAEQNVDAGADVGVASACCTAQQIALGQERRQQRGKGHAVKFTGAQQHVRKTWMHAQGGDLPAVRRDATFGVGRVELGKQIRALPSIALGRRVEPFEIVGVAYSPKARSNASGARSARQDLRRREWREALLRLRAPRAIAHTARVRPALPWRCSADAREMRSVSSRLMPVAGSNTRRRTSP